MKHPYKGCLIDVRTLELPNDSGWRSLVAIERHEDSQVVVTGVVTIPRIFNTEVEAEEAGISFGKDKIDSLLT